MKVAHHSFLEEVSDDQVSPEGGYSTPDILCRQSRPKHPPPYQSFNFNFGQPPPGVDAPAPLRGLHAPRHFNPAAAAIHARIVPLLPLRE